jgi:hypothetical protein
MQKKYFLFLICGLFLWGCSATSSRYVKKPATADKDERPRYSDNVTVETIEPSYELPEGDDEEIEPVPDDESIDITEIMSRFESGNNTDISADQSTVREKTLMEIIKYLNTPYKFGGNSTKGIDCSAFTQTVYSNAASLNLLRTARDQYTQGISIEKTELQFGDLVFFNTRRRVRPGHVGIYIGDNLFAHASSKHGVIVSSLDHQYYLKTYMGARRLNEAIF